MDISTEKEKEVLNLTATMWNQFIELENNQPDDINDFRYHIHSLQRLVYTKIYIKENGKL